MFDAYHPYHSKVLLLEGVRFGDLSQTEKAEFTWSK